MKPFFEYISRIGKSRGFGIQSPWAYSFVRDVLFESLPYYSYEDVDKRCSSRRERKYQKLFLRLRNFAAQEHLSYKTADFGSLDLSVLTLGTLLVITNTDKNYSKLVDIKILPQVGITFDLYYCLICFPPTPERPKQDYKLNF